MPVQFVPVTLQPKSPRFPNVCRYQLHPHFPPFKHTHKIAACVSYPLAQIPRITFEESNRDVSQVGGKQLDRSLSSEAALRSTSPGWHRSQPCLSANSSTSEPGQVDRSYPGAGPASRVPGSLGLFGNDLREESAADAELRLFCRSAADFHRFRTQLEPILDWGSAHLEEGGIIRPFIIHGPMHNQRWPPSDSYLD